MGFYLEFQRFFLKSALMFVFGQLLTLPLNPHWYCPIIWLACGFSLPYNTIDSTLYAILTNKIPLKFSQFWTSPFLCIGQIKASTQLKGILSSFQI